MLTNTKFLKTENYLLLKLYNERTWLSNDGAPVMGAVWLHCHLIIRNFFDQGTIRFHYCIALFRSKEQSPVFHLGNDAPNMSGQQAAAAHSSHLNGIVTTELSTCCWSKRCWKNWLSIYVVRYFFPPQKLIFVVLSAAQREHHVCTCNELIFTFLSEVLFSCPKTHLCFCLCGPKRRVTYVQRIIFVTLKNRFLLCLVRCCVPIVYTCIVGFEVI